MSERWGALVAAHGLSPEHPPAVVASAGILAESLDLHDPLLLDLRHLPFVTIDEVHSRDLDQAVAIERLGDGFRVWYALADASWFVRPGSPVFDEALKRGASYYLPGLVIPMLPPILSEDRISLGPAVDRRAMVFEVDLDLRGVVQGVRVHRARVRSRYKLDFDGVQAMLDGRSVDWEASVQASLRLLPEVGTLRASLAEGRDVVRHRRAEVEVKLVGQKFVAFDGPRNAVERYNEQISVLVNTEGARLLFEGDTEQDEVHPVYRVHEPPGPERLASLVEQTREIARLHGLDASWIWSPEREGLGAYLDRLPDDAVGRAIHRQAMIINRSSRHSAVPGAHHGVGAELYARFTAPMREIVGVFLHGELWERLGRSDAPDPATHGEALREQVLRAANRANEVQRALDRETNRVVLDALFADDQAAARTRNGTVLGLTPSRVHVQLDAPRVDVKVYTQDLESAWGVKVTLRGSTALTDPEGSVRLRVGDRVEIQVAGRDPGRDRWALRATPIRLR